MSDSKERNKVYIASKVGGTMEGLVKALRRTLELAGYEIVYDWTELPIEKPFEKNQSLAHEAAERMAKAAMQCDTLIVLATQTGGAGYFIETGGALVASIILQFIQGQKHKDIYIVGPGNDRSVFFFHDSVTRVKDIPELMETLGLD